jgi:transposase-like protein
MALIKMLFLAYQDIYKKWENPCHGWPKILNQFYIKFGDRLKMVG